MPHPNRSKEAALSIDTLKARLAYGPHSGIFTWISLPAAARIPLGSRAGYKIKNGYRHIKVNDIAYMEHRLAWFYVTGEWPRHDIDHDNLIRDDNRFCNLYDVPNAMNAQKRTLHRDNKSGQAGVFWHAKQRRWHAFVNSGGRPKHLGSFREKDEAVAVRLSAEKIHLPYRHRA